MKKIFLLMTMLINCYAIESSNESLEANKFDKPASLCDDFSNEWFFNGMLKNESLLPDEIVQYDNTTITDVSLIKILQDKKEPKDIKCIIIKGSFLTDEGISNITKYCPNLKILSLHGDYITDLGIEILSFGCPKLEFLSLDAIKPGLISDIGLSFLINNYSKLKALCLENHHNITQFGMELFEKNVACDFFYYTPSASFDYDDDEHSIELCGFGCTDEKLLEIIKTSMPSLLKKIDISFEPLLSEKAIFYIAEYCPNLIDLCITDNVLTDEGLITLSRNCKKLKFFEGNISNSKVTDQGLLAFAESCSNITSLNLTLSNSNIKNEDISNLIKKLPNLEELAFRGYLSLSDELRILKIDMDVEYNKQQFKHYEKLEENLQSAPSFLTDMNILDIAKNCPNLKTIHLTYNPNITYLSIMELLKCCQNLKELYLYGTSLTKEDIDRILELYPNIEIEYGIFPNEMESVTNSL